MGEKEGRGAAVAAGAAGGSLITYLLTKVGEAKASPPPEGMDPQTWDMLVSMLEGMAVQQEQVQQVVSAVNNLTVTLGGQPSAGLDETDAFSNMPNFTQGQVICTALNQGFQLPSIPIPKNKQLVVKALPGNVGWVYVASKQADSQNIAISYPLLLNEGIGLFIKNAQTVWVSTPPPPLGALNNGVAYLVEQE